MADDDNELRPEYGETRITLRLPIVLRDALTAKANASGRSMNAEIVQRLERTILEEDQYGNIYDFTGELDRRLDEIEYKVGVLWDVHNGRDPYNVDK